jgi:integrase/recombinase XerD
MGQLCERMRRDMTLANYSPHTIKNYLLYCKGFARHFMRSPAEMGAEEIKTYLLHGIQEKKWSASSCRQCHAALTFLYKTTLRRDDEVAHLPFPRKIFKLPVVLSGSEVQAIFTATRDVRFSTIFQTLYATGMRISEVLKLTVADIDSERMVIHIRQAKGNKDRYVPLSEKLLRVLRDYWRKCRLTGTLLFPGASGRPLNPERVRHALHKVVKDAGIQKKVTPHTLRHSYATHMLECGADVVEVQKLLGHKSLDTTMVYLHISRRQVQRLTLPFDVLGTPEGEILG